MPPHSRKKQPADTSQPDTPPNPYADDELVARARAALTSSTGKRVPRSIYLDEELLERARATVTHLSAYKPEAGVRSLSDIFILAGWLEVLRLEAEFNHGKPFRKVARMPTGRPVQGD
jgi:post-segregation antitoxin (ccd killing protein)